MINKFIQNVIDIRGEEGKKWLENIPNIIKEYEEKWSLRVSKPFSLSYNYVAPAERLNGEKVVLKIGFPENTEFISEIEALKIFNGEGVEKILEVDKDKAIMLLERVIPGKTLDQLEDDELETKIACNLLERIWKPAPKNDLLIQLPTWLNGFKKHRDKYNGTTEPFPENLFSHAENFFNEFYLKPAKNPILTHGDFHHKNILSSIRDEYLAIDPKGIIGDKTYDIASFLNNPRPELLNRPNVKQIVKRRIEIFSYELGIDKKQIINWGITQSILSAIWSLEDHGKGWEYGIKFAELLLEIDKAI